MCQATGSRVMHYRPVRHYGHGGMRFSQVLDISKIEGYRKLVGVLNENQENFTNTWARKNRWLG